MLDLTALESEQTYASSPTVPFLLTPPHPVLGRLPDFQPFSSQISS